MTIEDIDFPETRAYVKGVLEKQREYRHTYEIELGY
jgi:soluble lytic murein transglycosylase-like protein